MQMEGGGTTERCTPTDQPPAACHVGIRIPCTSPTAPPPMSPLAPSEPQRSATPMLSCVVSALCKRSALDYVSFSTPHPLSNHPLAPRPFPFCPPDLHHLTPPGGGGQARVQRMYGSGQCAWTGSCWWQAYTVRHMRGLDVGVWGCAVVVFQTRLRGALHEGAMHVPVL